MENQKAQQNKEAQERGKELYQAKIERDVKIKSYEKSVRDFRKSEKQSNNSN